jgi:hypothetical protein
VLCAIPLGLHSFINSITEGFSTSFRLFARVHVHVPRAGLAVDEAAPVELAVAALLDRQLLGVVPAPAAHEAAAVHAVRGAVADAALGACDNRT